MKFTVELVKFEPTYTISTEKDDDGNDKEVKTVNHWDLAFEIIHENNIHQFTPTTVYPHQMQEATEANIVELAARNTLPGQVAMAYQLAKERENV